MIRTLLRVAVAAGALAAGSASAVQPGAWIPLFTGTLEGWTVENAAPSSFVAGGGVLRVEEPGGWLRSNRRYGDFALRVQFRFVTPGADSGIFVRAAAESTFGRGWPANSYQVQLRDPGVPSPFPPVGGFFRHGTPAGETAFDEAAALRAHIGVGAWQTLEIALVGDRLTASLNGIEVLRAGDIGNSPGHIGIQAETGVLEFRSIEIREDDAPPTR